MVEAILIENILGMGEHLDRSTLIGGYCDGVSIFLDGRHRDLIGAAVVSEMDDFASLRLENSPEDSNRRIMTIENRCRGDDAKWHPARPRRGRPGLLA